MKESLHQKMILITKELKVSPLLKSRTKTKSYHPMVQNPLKRISFHSWIYLQLCFQVGGKTLLVKHEIESLMKNTRGFFQKVKYSKIRLILKGTPEIIALSKLLGQQGNSILFYKTMLP